MNQVTADISTVAQSVRHPLERLLAPLAPVPVREIEAHPTDPNGRASETYPGSVECVRGAGDPVWLTSNSWRVFARAADVGDPPTGTEIARFSCSDGRTVCAWHDIARGVVIVPFSLAEAYENYVSEGWKDGTSARQLSPRQLAVFYSLRRMIPRPIQLAGRRLLARWQQGVQFPAWPYDDSVASLVRLYARCLLLAGNADQLEFRWFWPENYHAALILTHDVESADGLRLAVEIADLEEERGLRSSFNIVAEGYPVDHGILRELRDRGFELGVHGIHHDRSMFSSRRAFEAQLPQISAWANKIGAVGFRSPATHRVFQWLGELPLEYDCTVPHSDPYEPIPGGACTPWPFFIGDVVELPYSLPQDHTLFTILDERTIDVWVRQVDHLEQRFGLIQCVTHPDPGYLGDPRKRAYYIELLDDVRHRNRVWVTLPRDVARWWRERDTGSMSDRTSRGVARQIAATVVIAPGT
jgi:peptidoglycan/xylan/chitin deacetylase (PgdA/CDA1 family)